MPMRRCALCDHRNARAGPSLPLPHVPKGERWPVRHRGSGAAASLRKVSKIGTELFGYVIAVLRRHRPDLDDIGLVAVLRELGRAEGLSAWLRKVLRHADLPSPPWDGTEAIAPLRTVAEIHATGVGLRN